MTHTATFTINGVEQTIELREVETEPMAYAPRHGDLYFVAAGSEPRRAGFAQVFRCQSSWFTWFCRVEGPGVDEAEDWAADILSGG